MESLGRRNAKLTVRWALSLLSVTEVFFAVSACGAWFESKIALLDPAVGQSDGVVFCLRVLDKEGNGLANLLEKPVGEDGFWVVRRDLSRFAGQEIALQLEVSPGPHNNSAWDWAVWHRPAVRSADGALLLDMLEAFDQADVGYILSLIHI